MSTASLTEGEADMTPASPALQVRGIVVEAATGRPLPEFAVAALPELFADGGEAEWEAPFEPEDVRFVKFAAEDGAYTLSVPTPGRYRFAAQAQDHLPSAVAVDVGAHGAHAVNLRLSPGWSLCGRILDSSGRPVVGAFVAIKSLHDGDELGAATDEFGAFRLPPAPAAHYAVTVLAEGLPTLHIPEHWLDARSTAQPQDWQLPLGASVHGAVRTATQPVRGEVVFAHEAGAVRRVAVAGDGSFAASGLSPGRHLCRFEPTAASTNSYMARQLSTKASSALLLDGDAVPIVVDDPSAQLAQLHVTAVDRAGAAAVGLTLELEPESHDWPPALLAALRGCTNARGVATLSGVPPGRYRLIGRRGAVEAASAAVEARPLAQVSLQLLVR